MTLINPCVKYLGFDDRKLMLFGMPVMAMSMPILLNLSFYLKEYGYWTHQVPETFIFVIGFWLIYRGMMIVMRKKYPSYNQAAKRSFLQVIIILVSAPILKVVFGVISAVLMSLCGINEHGLPGLLQMMISIYIPCFLIVAVYEAIYYFMQYKNVIIERERLQTQHVQTELSNLRNQINPHFLFNSLNTLMNLIPTDQEAAMNYLSKLSKFYRYAVGVKEEKLIPLTKEIEFANLFIDLLNERFKDALDVAIKIEEPQGQMIPPLSLQLLIENAVKHNVVSKESPLKIDIEFDASVGELIISNNVQKKLESVKSSGIGLDNIKRRFQYYTLRPVKVIHNLERFQVALPTISA